MYTRTITAPRWGARATGKEHGVAYTVLVAEDGGGGSVIIPGPNGSALAPQDFRSHVIVGRARRDLGQSFVSVLATARETDGNGHNRVVGPDFQWRPSGSDVVFVAKEGAARARRLADVSTDLAAICARLPC